MFGKIEAAAAAFRDAADEIEHGALSGEQAAHLVRLFTHVERLAAAGRTLAARRVDETKVWQRGGHRTAATWIASETGTTLGQAISVLETGHRLKDLQATREAFLEGRLSETQAREISGAATNQRTENALLALAYSQSVTTLRQECRRVRAANAEDGIEAYEAIRRTRYLRYWSDPDGSVRLDARMTPDDGASVIATIEARQARIADEAARSGRRERSQAYAADALVELARAGGSGPVGGPRAMVHVLVDHEVLTAGRVRTGQRCEIPGVGPIAAATARAMTGDSILKLITTRGTDIKTVVHAGRTIPARLRTALEIRDPTCVVPQCDVRRNLEIDHYRIAFADGGPTRMDNLARLCRWHHYQRTHLGYRLSGKPGSWRWETPSDLEGPRPPPDP